MKTMFNALLILGGILIIGSCEKKETDIFSDDALSSLKSNQVSSSTILVEPVGPMYDTENLKEAFAEAEDAGPGAVIKLAEGEFYLDKLDIYDFHGVLKGSGKGFTIIHPIPGGINIPVTTAFENSPYLIEFHGGDITVSDITFDISEDNPVKPYDLYTGGSATFLAAVIRVSGSSVENYAANSKFQNLSFMGKYVELIDFTPYNIDNCILLGGGFACYSFVGKHVIQNCDFSNVETGITGIGLANGNLTIGGSPVKANSITNANTGVFFIAGSHMEVEIRNNKMEKMHAFGGITIVQDEVPPNFNETVEPSGCEFLIQDNVIELVGPSYWAAGIFMCDITGSQDETKQSKIKIEKNLFKLTGEYQDAIDSYSTFNSLALQNIVTGQSGCAIWLYGSDSGCKMIFNDFNNYESLWGIDIIMDENTSNNVLICETDKTSVYDAGDMNTIKGPAERGVVWDINKLNLLKKMHHNPPE